jgi:hypothetical protein
MIWADRIGIVWGLVVLGVCWLMAGGFDWRGYPFSDFVPFCGYMLAIFAAPPWLLLRGVDFICTGAIRHRA